MGFFDRQNRDAGQSSATTLIAEGCNINGHLKVANKLQIDGNVDGQIEADSQVTISKSGLVSGEIHTDRLIVNGNFEGVCHATHIEILSCGRVNGTIYSDNLSIEPGGKFTGVTNPSEGTDNEQQTLDLVDKIALIGND